MAFISAAAALSFLEPERDFDYLSVDTKIWLSFSDLSSLVEGFQSCYCNFNLLLDRKDAVGFDLERDLEWDLEWLFFDYVNRIGELDLLRRSFDLDFVFWISRFELRSETRLLLASVIVYLNETDF